MIAPQLNLSLCPHCGSHKFGVVRDVWVEMVSEAKIARGNVLAPRFDVVVCPGCGWTQMFARKDKAFLLDTCKHEVVDVGSPSPYR